SETIIDIDTTSTPLESDNLNTKTSQTSIEFEQKQTTTFYSIPPSPIQILDSRSAPVSLIIPLTFFNISSTLSNISLLTSTANHWSSVAVNRNIEQSSSSSYTLLYPQLDTSNNFSSKFSSISISTQHIVPLTTWNIFHPDNYNTETQYTSIYSNISDTEKTTQTPLNNQSDLDSEQSFGKAYTIILNQSNSSDSETKMNDAA
ncbi:25217_t:CDS:2, partial [Gigaspora margarita]